MSFTSENVDDRLSRLPMEILSHVLSLMPTRFAVRTSILSKRWRYTWMHVTNLDFDYTGGHPFDESPFNENVFKENDRNEINFTKFVDRVLKFCKTSHVKLFRLHISAYYGIQVLRSRVSNWIDSAVRLNVRELDLCVINLELPLSLFTCKTLTNLRLDFSVGDYLVFEVPSLVYLPCLKSLDIAGSHNSLCDVFKLTCGCPVLESLSLEAFCCNNEDDCVFNIPTLKRLKLRHCSASKNIDINRVVLRVPKLEYLFVGGILCTVFVMEDVSSLVGASIACWDCTFDNLWADLLNKISGLQNLSIESFPFTSPLPDFPNMVQLELNDVWKFGQITQFLESCAELKSLCIDFVAWREFKPEEVSWVESEPKLIPACMLTNLTTFEFSKCEEDACDMEFLEYMLRNAQVLKTVTVYARENLLTEEDSSFCAKLLKVPRASPNCEINFRAWKLPLSPKVETYEVEPY